MTKKLKRAIERLEVERMPQPWGVGRVVIRTRSANMRDGTPQLTDAMVIGANCSGIDMLRLPDESMKALISRAAAMYDGPGAPVIMLRYRRPEPIVLTGK